MQGYFFRLTLGLSGVCAVGSERQAIAREQRDKSIAARLGTHRASSSQYLAHWVSGRRVNSPPLRPASGSIIALRGVWRLAAEPIFGKSGPNSPVRQPRF